MNHNIIESVVGPDGTLELKVPMGMNNANQPVRIVVEPIPKQLSHEEWFAVVQSLGGSISDPTFVRPPQLPLDTNELFN